MFSPVERMVAMRYLRARRREGFISVIALFSLLGIALGVATLIIVMAVMNGFRHELLARILGLNGHVNIFAAEAGPLTGFDALAERIRGLERVRLVAPTVEAQALVTVQGRATGAVVRGMRPADFAHRGTLADNLVASGGGFGDDRIAIGHRMARRLGLWAGDSLTLVAPQGKTTAFGTIPRVRTYEIGLVFDVGMYEYDNTFIFMPLDAAQTFFRTGADGVTSLEVFVDDPNDMAPVRRSLLIELGVDARVVDWQQTNRSFFNALAVERNVMFLILTLIILVAAFNIISGMIMLVKDKGRDIAILRTMGATRGMVMRIFFLSGASIGVVGTLAGFALGVVFCENIETIRQALQSLTGATLFDAEIYFLSTLPAEMEWNEVLQVVAMALGLSFGATLYPSWRAARLDPVEALRYE